jgi:transposase
MAAPKKYPDELRERAVRLYRSSTPRPTFRQLGEQLGVHHEALRNWVRQAEADDGQRDDRPTSAETEELRRDRGAAPRPRSCAGCARKSASCAGPTKS